MVRINGEASTSPPGRPQQELPSEGTNARLVYDLLREHRGRRVPDADWAALADLVPNLASEITYLRRFYRLEIYDHRLISEPGPRIYYV